MMLASEYGANYGSIIERGNFGLINSESFDDEDYHLESIQYLKGT